MNRSRIKKRIYVYSRLLKRKMRKHHIKRSYVFLCLLLAVMMIVGFIAYAIYDHYHCILTNENLTLSIGEKVDLKSYIKSNFKDVKINKNDLDIHKVGKYTVNYTTKDRSDDLIIKVVDDKAPVVKLKKQYLTETNASIKAEDLVESVKDDSDYSLSLDSKSSYAKEGKYSATVKCIDIYKNKTESQVEVVVREDTTAPIINTKEPTYYLTHKKNYQRIFKVKDDFDPSPIVQVDDKKVNYKLVGKYPVTVTLTDRAGNTETYNTHINVCEPVGNLYVTIDDGPSKNTRKIVDILKEKGGHVTFFVTCNNKKYRNNIKYAYDNGHAIALHTAHHNYAKLYSSEEAFMSDLKEVQTMVKKITGKEIFNSRFPGGSSNQISNRYHKGIMKTLVKSVVKEGFTYYDWNVDSGDAEQPRKTAAQIYKRSTSNHFKDVMLLCHDSYTKSETAKAMGDIIDFYLDKGYAIKSIEEGDFNVQHRK